MRVVASPEAQEFIAARGGVAWVRPLRQRCCGGGLTVLEATTKAPADAGRYEPVGDPAFGVRYRGELRPGGGDGAGDEPAAARERLRPAGAGDRPSELLIELRGRRRPRLIACWDGCLFRA